MRRREDKAINKHTLNLYAGDYEKLQSIYGTRVGAAKVIRDMVHNHIKYIQNKAEQKVNISLIEELDIPLITESSNEQ